MACARCSSLRSKRASKGYLTIHCCRVMQPQNCTSSVNLECFPVSMCDRTCCAAITGEVRAQIRSSRGAGLEVLKVLLYAFFINQLCKSLWTSRTMRRITMTALTRHCIAVHRARTGVVRVNTLHAAQIHDLQLTKKKQLRLI